MTLHALWLGHPDARKVFDCSIETNPEGRYSIAGSATLMRGKSSTVELRTNPEGRYSIAGSATLMRGKSSTCRQAGSYLFGSLTLRFTVIDRKILERTLRQVKDLPRIRVAEPALKAHH